MAKIFKIRGYYIDPNDCYTKEELETALSEDYDIISHHIRIEQRDIGEWDDDSPLNQHNCSMWDCEKYFKGGVINDR